MSASADPSVRQRARRDSRREANRTEILDAAEAVFARDGLHNASMRSISAEAGFSTAAIYLFFDNRQHLLAETLTRRGDALNDLIEATIAAARDPIDALHRVVDEDVAFFVEHDGFRRMLHELRGGPALLGPALADYAQVVEERMNRAQRLLAETMEAGQRRGLIRRGNPLALAQMYMVLVNEFVFLRSDTDIAYPDDDFHALLDGAFAPPGSVKAVKDAR